LPVVATAGMVVPKTRVFAGKDGLTYGMEIAFSPEIDIPSVREPGPLRTSWLHAPDEIDRLEDDWRQMAAALPPMAQFDWTRACLQAFGSGATGAVLTVRRGDELVAVAPLVR